MAAFYDTTSAQFHLQLGTNNHHYVSQRQRETLAWEANQDPSVGSWLFLGVGDVFPGPDRLTA